MSIPTGPYAALKIPDFRLFILARFCVTLGIQIQSVVVAWQVYDLTLDPLSLGLIGLAEAIPSITVSLYAGHVADVISRKKIILVCLGTLLFCSA
jgi:MFS family permease